MTAADRLADLYSASIPATPRRRSRATGHIGAFLTGVYRAGDEILAGAAGFPATRRPSQACPQCQEHGDLHMEVGNGR
jgi:hypothetical protein